MIASLPDDSSPERLTPKWRQEALLRLFTGVATGTRNSGTPLNDCLVPLEAVDHAGVILESKNTYQKVRIDGRDYPAHAAVLMLIHNRHPRRSGDWTVDEVAMHLCNNPCCRKPTHLKFGTRLEDSRHKVLCGRAPTGEASGHSTKPERTPRSDSHYNTRLKGEKRLIAAELIKKYGHLAGYAPAIAVYLGTTVYTIQNLKRKGAHLSPEVKETEIKLLIQARSPREYRPERKKNSAEHRRRIAGEIRRRFHDCPVHERSGMLLQFETEYGYTSAWIRRILKRDVFPEVAPEIPVPTEWGVGRRKSYKQDPRE